MIIDRENRLLMPDGYFLASVLAAILLHLFLPLKYIFLWPDNFLGLIFIIFGTALVLYCNRLFIINKTTIKPFAQPSKLLTIGPYKYSRNPMYLGAIIVLAGIAVLLGSITPYLAVLFMFCQFHFYFIPAEEKILNQAFGTVYQNYKKRVRKWI